MSRLTWDEPGARIYETGVSQGVLYIQDSSGNYEEGIPWNGLVGVTEKIVPGDSHAVYGTEARKYEFYDEDTVEATISAYTFPVAFSACDGTDQLALGTYLTQQDKQSFGFCYKTILGNAIEGNDYAYKLHILYGCKATVSDREYQSLSDSPELVTFEWDVKTTPIAVTGANDASMIIVDSSLVPSHALEIIEEYLYGTETSKSKLLTPNQILQIVNDNGGTIINDDNFTDVFVKYVPQTLTQSQQAQAVWNIGLGNVASLNWQQVTS